MSEYWNHPPQASLIANSIGENRKCFPDDWRKALFAAYTSPALAEIRGILEELCRSHEPRRIDSAMSKMEDVIASLAQECVESWVFDPKTNLPYKPVLPDRLYQPPQA